MALSAFTWEEAFYEQRLLTEVTMPGKHGEADIHTNSLVGLFEDAIYYIA
jgi:hypothetical protein